MGPSLRETFLIFLRLGAIGFGGPIALIGMMEEEFVQKRKVLSRSTFEENYLYCKMMPGPVAYQMALSIGRELNGTVGALLSGLGLLIPAFILMCFLCVGYSQLRNVSWTGGLITGMRLGAVVVIIDSVWRLLKPYLKQKPSWIYIGVGAALTFFYPKFEILAIVLCGVAGLIYYSRKSKSLNAVAPLGLLFQLFWVHAKAAFFVFGTGLAVLPVLQHEAVGRGWVTNEQFIDGVAFGQITPGPITITSVFVGYQAASWLGAIAAFTGMYFPGILLVLILIPWISRQTKNSNYMQSFQRGAVPAVVGCLIAAALQFTVLTVNQVSTGIIFLLLALTTFLLHFPSWLTILTGSFLGLGSVLGWCVI